MLNLIVSAISAALLIYVTVEVLCAVFSVQPDDEENEDNSNRMGVVL